MQIRTLSQSLEDLVSSAISGRADAFEALYVRFAPAVHGILLARMHPSDADDLVQEVFLEGWQKLSQLREPEAFAGWICAIARRRATDWSRRRRVTEPLPSDLSVDAPAESRVEAARVLAALRRLPQTYRETLMLRLVSGLSGQEIAVATGLTKGSVRVNLHRGLRLLRQELGVEDGS